MTIRNQPWITWIYHVTFIALNGGPIFLRHRIARRRWTQTHLGSILSKSASVFFFSSISCPVLSTTSSSKLSAYFSIMYTMLSKMFVFLLSEQQKGTLQWCYKKTRMLTQKSCPWRGDVLWVKFKKMTSVFQSIRLPCFWSWISSWHCPPSLVASNSCVSAYWQWKLANERARITAVVIKCRFARFLAPTALMLYRLKTDTF